MLMPLLLGSLLHTGFNTAIAAYPQEWAMFSLQDGQTRALPDNPSTVSERRQTAPFNRIVLHDGISAEVFVGPDFELMVEAPPSILSLVEVTVMGSTLTASASGSYATSTPPTLRVSLPQLASAEARSSGNLKIVGLEGGTARLVRSGSGRLEAAGAVDVVEVLVSGSGTADISELSAAQGRIDASGTSSTKIGNTQALSVSASGRSQVRFYGRPEPLTVSVSGRASVGAESGE